MDLIKFMQVVGNMKNSRIIFDHVKHLKDWTLVCHVYDNKYRKVLTICVVTCNLKMT